MRATRHTEPGSGYNDYTLPSVYWVLAAVTWSDFYTAISWFPRHVTNSQRHHQVNAGQVTGRVTWHPLDRNQLIGGVSLQQVHRISDDLLYHLNTIKQATADRLDHTVTKPLYDRHYHVTADTNTSADLLSHVATVTGFDWLVHVATITDWLCLVIH